MSKVEILARVALFFAWPAVAAVLLLLSVLFFLVAWPLVLTKWVRLEL